MAERRMFAKQIIDSDAFLDMPLSTQCLYFHLSMRADDEGFINNPKKIQRTIGASDDDLKLLIAKSFIIPFESGIVVIKHWKIHNYIRGDRLHQTKYTEEKALLSVKENGSYTVCQSNVSQLVDTLDTEVRLGKDSIGKDSIGKDRDIARVRLGIYNNVQLTKGELNELMRIYPNDYQDMIENLSTYMRSKGKYYEDHYATMMAWKRRDEAKAKEEKKPGNYWDEFDKLKEELKNDEG